MISRFAGFLACGVALFVATAVIADSAALDELYGDGVHNFFSGDFVGAHQGADVSGAGRQQRSSRLLLPRFGLLAIGARAGCGDRFQSWREARNERERSLLRHQPRLERVQGRERAILERSRTQARLVAQQDLQRRRYERYERIRSAEPDVLMKPAPAAAKKRPAPTAPPVVANEDPFSDKVPAPEGAAEEGAVADVEATTETEPATEMAVEADVTEEPAADVMPPDAPAADEPAIEAPATPPSADPFGDTPEDAAPAATDPAVKAAEAAALQAVKEGKAAADGAIAAEAAEADQDLPGEMPARDVFTPQPTQPPLSEAMPGVERGEART